MSTSVTFGPQSRWHEHLTIITKCYVGTNYSLLYTTFYIYMTKEILSKWDLLQNPHFLWIISLTFRHRACSYLTLYIKTEEKLIFTPMGSKHLNHQKQHLSSKIKQLQQKPTPWRRGQWGTDLVTDRVEYSLYSCMESHPGQLEVQYCL